MRQHQPRQRIAGGHRAFDEAAVVHGAYLVAHGTGEEGRLQQAEGEHDMAQGRAHRGDQGEGEQQRWDEANCQEKLTQRPVGNAAEQPGQQSRRRAEADAEQQGGQRYGEGIAGAVDHAGEDVASGGIGAERMN